MSPSAGATCSRRYAPGASVLVVELEDSPQLPAEVVIERARKQVGPLAQPAPGA